jgi:sensor histidine kinase YesM
MTTIKTRFADILYFFKHNPFWQKWSGWVLAIFVIVITFDYSGAVQGFKDGWKSVEDSSASSVSDNIAMWVFLPIGLSFFLLIWTGLAHIYYVTIHFLFFRKLNLGKIVAFGFLLLSFVEISSEYFCKKDPSVGLGKIMAYELLILLYFIAYSFIKDFYRKQREQAELLQQKTEAELTSLKAQVNPHFLFNSLNNIYGTAIVEAAPQTANSLQQLSGIMRYVLEKSAIGKVSVADEIKFLNDYTQMHELRLPKQDNIRIDTQIEWDEQPADIVPLLLSSVVENAFKYGISLDKRCFVSIDFDVTNGRLRFGIQNSIVSNNDLEKGTGMGLDNLRQRLALAYPNRHSLVVSEDNGVFEVKLEIDLA